MRQATSCHDNRAVALDVVEPALSLKDVLVDVLRIILQILLVLTSGFLTLLVLMHKGKGGGLSDMFGGGISSSVGSSGVAERNLNRITVTFALVWAVVIVLLGLIQKVS